MNGTVGYVEIDEKQLNHVQVQEKELTQFIKDHNVNINGLKYTMTLTNWIIKEQK